MSHRATWFAIAIGGTALLLGCAEGTGPTAPCGIGAPCSSVTLQSLTLTPKYDTLLVGDTAEIVFSATNSSGATVTSSSIAVTYASSDTLVATVDTTGGVHAIGVGNTTLKVSAGGLSATAALTVLTASVLQIQAGDDYTCMVTTLGRGYCWGLDNLDQLASAVSTTCFYTIAPPAEPCAITPTAMTGGLRFDSITTGGIMGCGIIAGGAAYCWGDNSYGELGNNTTGGSATPIPVSGGLAYVSISAGGAHVCGIATTGGTYCWGKDSLGQLGQSGLVHSTTPIPATAPVPFTLVTAGASHTCALASGGTAYCWGDNTFAQLGNGTVGGDSSLPTAIVGFTFTAISAGATHTCGIVSGGAAYCWGTYNGVTNSTPTPVPGGQTFTQITSGNGFSCALSGTAVYCWGDNTYGELASGTFGGTATSPSLVTGGLTFTHVSAGTRHVCARLASGGAACWGSDLFGPLGNTQQAEAFDAPVIVGAPLSS